MRRDIALMLDMMQAARRAQAHVARVSEAEFALDELRQDATLHCLILVGEAAAQVSTTTRAHHPSIDWQRIVGMRNVLVHDYRHVDAAKVWATLHDDLPTLIATLEPLIPPEDSAEL